MRNHIFFYKINFLMLLSVLTLLSPTKAAEPERCDRNWVRSLNVYYKGQLLLENDKWFDATTKEIVNDNYNEEIRKNLKTSKKGGGGNIAYIKHIVIYKIDSIKLKIYDPQIVFRSGTTLFKTEGDLKKNSRPIIEKCHFRKN